MRYEAENTTEQLRADVSQLEARAIEAERRCDLEKQGRIFYQDIVYAVCDVLDSLRPISAERLLAHKEEVLKALQDVLEGMRMLLASSERKCAELAAALEAIRMHVRDQFIHFPGLGTLTIGEYIDQQGGTALIATHNEALCRPLENKIIELASALDAIQANCVAGSVDPRPGVARSSIIRIGEICDEHDYAPRLAAHDAQVERETLERVAKYMVIDVDDYEREFASKGESDEQTNHD